MTIEIDGNKLEYEFVDDKHTGERHVVIKSGREAKGDLVIPRQIDGRPVTEIDYGSFCNCGELTSVTLPDGVKNIAACTFEGCSGLRSVTMPESVESIGLRAFFGCSGLTSVTIPDGVTSIEQDAFNGCSGLRSVSIGKGVTRIRDAAFCGCHKLADVTISGSVSGPGHDVFGGCDKLADPNGFVIRGGVLYGYFGSGGEIAIPDGVARIAPGAFCERRELTGVTMPDGLIDIGKQAFYYCSGLKRAVIPNSLMGIWDSAFGGCYGSRSVTRTFDGATSIGDSAFEGCGGLTYVTIPNGVTSIGNSAFEGCYGLTDVTIPDSVRNIGDNAFFGCRGLASVAVPYSVLRIGRNAFSGCRSLTGVVLTKWFEKEKDKFFRPCPGECQLGVMTPRAIIGETGVVVIPQGTKEIVAMEFAGNKQIKKLILPEGLERIGEYAFERCTNLETVEFPASLKHVGPSAFVETGVRHVSFAEGIRINCIGERAFCGCDIKELDIPGRVDVIAREAFLDAHLWTVRIRDGVKHIGAAAFYGCLDLSVFDVPKPPEIIGECAFRACGYRLAIPESPREFQVGKYPDGYASGVEKGTYLVIDISCGPNAEHYPVEYLGMPPEGGWGPVFKTDKIVFRLIEPHGFRMGFEPKRNVLLSHPYYIAVFPLTIGQWLNVMGGSIDEIREYRISADDSDYNDVDDDKLRRFTMTGRIEQFRSEFKGKEWPSSIEVSPDCLVGVLRLKTGIGNIDLPTEAEWEFACKEDDGGYASFGEHNIEEGAICCFGEVGKDKSNGWGLHDIGSGNAWEYCVDKYAENDNVPVIDPTGGVSPTKGNVLKGGWEYIGCGGATSSAENRIYDGDVSEHVSGARLCITMGTTINYDDEDYEDEDLENPLALFDGDGG